MVKNIFSIFLVVLFLFQNGPACHVAVDNKPIYIFVYSTQGNSFDNDFVTVTSFAFLC